MLKVKVLITSEEFIGCKCSQIIKKVKSSDKVLPLQLPSDGSTTSKGGKKTISSKEEYHSFVNIFSSKFPDGHQGFTNKKNNDGIRKRLKVIVSHEKRLIKEKRNQ